MMDSVTVHTGQWVAFSPLRLSYMTILIEKTQRVDAKVIKNASLSDSGRNYPDRTCRFIEKAQHLRYPVRGLSVKIESDQPPGS